MRKSWLSVVLLSLALVLLFSCSPTPESEENGNNIVFKDEEGNKIQIDGFDIEKPIGSIISSDPLYVYSFIIDGEEYPYYEYDWEGNPVIDENGEPKVNPVLNETYLSGRVNITIKREKVKVNVRFNLGSGYYDENGNPLQQYIDRTVDKGSEVNDPGIKATTLNGFILGGWRYSGEEVDFPIVADKSMTLYSWSKAPEKYRVSFNAQGASEIIYPQEITEGGLVERPKDPERENYIFSHWYVTGEDPDVPYDFSTPVTSDFSLTAAWIDEYYKVEFEGSAGIEPIMIAKGATDRTFTFPDIIPEKDGYEFKGWKTLYDNNIYAAGSDYTKQVSTDMVFTAEWEELPPPREFEISFVYVDWEGNVKYTDTRTVKEGEELTAPTLEEIYAITGRKDYFEPDYWAYTQFYSLKFGETFTATMNAEYKCTWSEYAKEEIILKSNTILNFDEIVIHQKDLAIDVKELERYLPSLPDGYRLKGYRIGESDEISSSLSSALYDYSIEGQRNFKLELVLEVEVSLTDADYNETTEWIEGGETFVYPDTYNVDGFIHEGWYEESDFITSPVDLDKESVILEKPITLYEKKIDSKIVLSGHEIGGLRAGDSPELTIPDRIHGEDVVIEGGVLQGIEGITSIFVHEGTLSSLRLSAFPDLERIYLSSTVSHAYVKDCPSLNFIDASEGVKTLDLSDLESFGAITLPSTLTTFNARAMASLSKVFFKSYPSLNISNCPELEAITLTGTNITAANITLTDLPKVSHIKFEGEGTIGDLRIDNLQEIYSIESTSGAKMSADSEIVVKDTQNLSKVSIPDGIERITDDAFSESKAVNLSTITIPGSVKVIGVSAFEGLTALNKINIPSALTDICDSAFSGCTALEEINLGNIEYLGWGAFDGCVLLTKVDISNATEICDMAFHGCTALESVTLSVDVKNLPASFFSGCSALKSVNTTSLETIGNSAFRASGIETIDIPNVIEIGENAFEDAKNLRTIILSDVENSVTLGRYAFAGCSSLESVGVPGISFSAFKNIPDHAFYGCSSLKQAVGINVDIGLYAFGGTNNLEKISIEEGCKSIGNYAFAMTKDPVGLIEIYLNSDLVSIGERAFDERIFRDLRIPPLVESIGFKAFLTTLDTLELEGLLGTDLDGNLNHPEIEAPSRFEEDSSWHDSVFHVVYY